jgi:hypothetical protein
MQKTINIKSAIAAIAIPLLLLAAVITVFILMHNTNDTDSDDHRARRSMYPSKWAEVTEFPEDQIFKGGQYNSLSDRGFNGFFTLKSVDGKTQYGKRAIVIVRSSADCVSWQNEFGAQLENVKELGEREDSITYMVPIFNAASAKFGANGVCSLTVSMPS